MWRLAFRQLTYDKLRSLLTALAISCAIAVILVLRGFEEGLYVQSESVVLNRGGDLIAAQSGITNFFVVHSSLPQLTRANVEAISGVAEAYPVTGIWIIYGEAGNKMPLFLMVHDTEGVGGPAHIIKGRYAQDGRDIVVDIGFSKKFNIEPGDALVISDFEFRVSGITEQDSALFSPLGFVTFDGIIDFFLESEVVPDISTFPLLSFLIIKTTPGADPNIVKQAIENAVPEVDVFTPAELASNDRAVGKELFGPIMGMLISLSYIIGLLVIGLIIYSDVSARQRSFAVMKALGFRLFHIAYSVVAQSFLMVIFAFPFGVLVAKVIAVGIEYNIPVYKVYIFDSVGLSYTLIGVILITFLGSLMPLRLVAKEDPVSAFSVD